MRPTHMKAHKWAVNTAALVMTIFATGCSLAIGMLRQQALEAIETNRLVDAQSQLAKAANREPGDGRAQLYLARVYLQVDLPLEAQLALEQALVQLPESPQTPEILDLLAEALYRQDLHAQLFTMLQQAAEDYGTTDDYLRQGDYLHKIGDADNAMPAYRKAIRFADPDDARPNLKMADFLEGVGDTRNAVKHLRHAYAIVPDHPDLVDRLRSYGLVPGPTIALKPERD